MDRLAFEQLVSAWLDDRQNNALRRQINAACAADPACRRLLAQYEKLEPFLRAAAVEAPRVNWQNFRKAVSTEIARTAPTTADSPELDALLCQALPGIETRIDWEHYARRVSGAVDNATFAGRVLHLRHWRPIMAVAGLAAAAAIILWIGIRPAGSRVAPPPTGPAVAVSEPRAAVNIQPAPAVSPAPSATEPPTVAIRVDVPGEPSAAPVVAVAVPSGPAVVQVHVIEDSSHAPAVAQADRREPADQASEPEVFFMLEPPDRTVLASAAGLGSH
jgi:hypothetical protein